MSSFNFLYGSYKLDAEPSSHRSSNPQVFQGVLERNMKYKLFLMGKLGAKLDVLLENMGRLSFGSNSSDYKVS